VLGRFLEWSISTPDIAASLDFYGRLGFTAATVGEAWSHPYAVVTDGRLCLGLHQQAEFAASLTFVKPDLLAHVDRFERMGIQFEFLRLGNDVFNEIGWCDPSGHLIRLIEARTFSPSTRKPLDTTSCGYFLELALPTTSPDTAKEFWERVGFVGIDDSQALLPHVALTSDSIDLGLYRSADLRAPTLVFDSDDLAGRIERLTAAGIAPRGRVPAPLSGSAALLHAPEGTPILLTSTQEPNPPSG
jgi:catechol 2,3-dioxygenase-like lactoylglutathione lyase family enzyme